MTHTNFMFPEINLFPVPEDSEMVLLLGPETDKYWLFVQLYFQINYIVSCSLL